MTARFTPSEIAAAAREARAGVEVELHKPDGSKIVVRPVDAQAGSAHVGLTGGNTCDKAFGP